MKYKFLRKFLRLRDGESSKADGCNHVFQCGIGWYWSIGGLAITKGAYPSIHGVAFTLQIKDLSKEWREKLDKHTSSTEYDLTVRKAGGAS